MKRLISLLICIIIAGCQERPKQNNTSKTDTTTFTKGDLYRQDSIHHPLTPFRLSYPEWETILCIIAVDETVFWDKAMIALIEKNGNLRIQYKNKKVYLFPASHVKIKQGEWLGTFKNDSMEIQISGTLESGRILRTLSGHGNLVFKTSDQTIEETFYSVYETEQN
jgi:hypothetical protein